MPHTIEFGHVPAVPAIAKLSAPTLLFVVAAASATGRLADAATLCTAQEQVVFSCSTGAKTVSVCASPGKAVGGHLLQYRLGAPGKVELAVSPNGDATGGAVASGTMMYSGGGGARLQFRSGAYRYTVFDAIGKWAKDGGPAGIAGVVVEKDGGSSPACSAAARRRA